MPFFKFEGSLGCSVGVQETFVVEANSEDEATEQAYEYWQEYVAADVGCEGKISKDEIESEGYNII